MDCDVLIDCSLNSYFFFTVPNPVDTLTAIAIGITCVNVSWSGPSILNGPRENLTYFVSYSDDLQGLIYTLDVGSNMSIVLNDLTPGIKYNVEVKKHASLVYLLLMSK